MEEEQRNRESEDRTQEVEEKTAQPAGSHGTPVKGRKAGNKTVKKESAISPPKAAKKPISLKKIRANRKNSARSTGPKTAKGKSVVRWNALKHGILAKVLVVPAERSQEIYLEFRDLLEQLHRDLQPVGPVEEMLVEKIADCYWRFGRVLRSESGEIWQALNNVEADALLQYKDAKLRGGDLSLSEQMEWERAETARLHLPEQDSMDKILRYETTVERQLYRALHHLERMQRRRAGEATPPPVSVEFSGA